MSGVTCCCDNGRNDDDPPHQPLHPATYALMGKSQVGIAFHCGETRNQVRTRRPRAKTAAKSCYVSGTQMNLLQRPMEILHLSGVVQLLGVGLFVTRRPLATVLVISEVDNERWFFGKFGGPTANQSSRKLAGLLVAGGRAG